MESITKKTEQTAADFNRHFGALKTEIAKIVVGQKDIVDQLLISLFSRGHCVLVGYPVLPKHF
jgi:MoxR-like ATPase